MSDLPLGGGLSSSAALEVATATALAAASGTALSPAETARLCQEAEQRFAGVPCGIMDQLASAMGDPAGALLIDCESERGAPGAAARRRAGVLVSNSQVQHALADGAYARRRAECAEAARACWGCASLRGATADAVEAARAPAGRSALPAGPPRHRRKRPHPGRRRRRWRRATTARPGALMYESHRSLRDDYEVSCHELDVLVDIARGAR